MKCSCGNLKIKHLPEDPHAGYTSVFNEQSTSPITGTVCNIYSCTTQRPQAFWKVRAHQRREWKSSSSSKKISQLSHCLMAWGLLSRWGLLCQPGTHIRIFQDKRQCASVSMGKSPVNLVWFASPLTSYVNLHRLFDLSLPVSLAVNGRW